MVTRPLGVLLLAAAHAGALTLARDGEATAIIVVADEASAAEKYAARELADWLGRATGATFEIWPAPPEGACIVVGPHAELAVPADAGPEEWWIRCRGERLELFGGRPRGTLYAVYRFLEDLVGIRWWSPWAEHVPSRPTLEIPALERSGEPAFRYRDLYDELPEPKLFALRNRINGHFTGLRPEHGGTLAYGPPYHVHTFFNYLPPDRYFAEHPEYYSLIDGQRRHEGAQLCLTNPEVPRLVTAQLRAWIAESHAAAAAAGAPPPTVFDISQNDWYGPCQCADCQRIAQAEGSEAGPLLWFLNQVADAIAADWPAVQIDTLAYQYTLDPPKTIRPRDNLIIRLCDLTHPDQARPLEHPNNQTFHESVLAWSRIAPQLRIWDYAVTYGDHNGLPFASLRTMPDDYRFFRANKVEGLFIEHEYPVTADLRDLKTWVQMKLLEDPERDLEALVREFTDGFYGPAAQPIRAYLRLLAEATDRSGAIVPAFGMANVYRYLDLEFCAAADARFDQAAAAVAGDTVLGERVDHARLPLDRAILFRWRSLAREHTTRGGTPETMPLDRDGVIGPRARATLQREYARRLPGAGGEAKLVADLAVIDAALRAPAFLGDPRAGLPPELAALPTERVHTLLPDSFRIWQHQAALIEDPSSPVKVAARVGIDAQPEGDREKYRLTPALPMPWGVYDTIGARGVKSASIAAEAVPGPGYQWYALEDVALTPGCYVYLFWSWIIQVDLDEVLSDDPTARYDLRLSLAFDGPWFPHGAADAPSAIRVDRLVVTRR